MYVGEVNESLVDDGLKVETIKFAEDTGVIIKNSKTNDVLLCLEKKELLPFIDVLKKANSMLDDNKI